MSPMFRLADPSAKLDTERLIVGGSSAGAVVTASEWTLEAAACTTSRKRAGTVAWPTLFKPQARRFPSRRMPRRWSVLAATNWKSEKAGGAKEPPVPRTCRLPERLRKTLEGLAGAIRTMLVRFRTQA